MFRVATQLTFCSPQKLLRRTVVEQDLHSYITRIFSLDDGLVESAHTLFFDGVLSAQIRSLKLLLSPTDIDRVKADFQYVDLSDDCDFVLNLNLDKKLILDFGTCEPSVINIKLKYYAQQLSQLSLTDVLSACTYYPALILGETSEIIENQCTKLIIWDGFDLVNKKFTNRTFVRSL